MRVTLLGTGTSHGVPAIGCDCAVCRSADPRDRRTRPSILIDLGDGADRPVGVRFAAAVRYILVDTSTDLRAQALATTSAASTRSSSRTATPITCSASTRCGASTSMQRSAIPCFGDAATLADLRRMFATSSTASRAAAAAFRSCRCSRSAAPFTLGGVEIVPVPLMHGPLPILGFRLGSFAYLTDCSHDPGVVVAAARRRSHARPRRAARPAAPHAFQRRRSARGGRAPRARAHLLHAHLPRSRRTPRPARACRRAWSWPMMGWSWRSRRDDRRGHERHTGTDRLCVSSVSLALIAVRVHGRHSLSRRPAAAALDAAGARARQLRRRAPRPSQDPRPRAAASPASAARRSVVMTFDPASAARRPPRQGAAAADDQGAEARGDSPTPACRAPRSCASRPSCRAGIRRRSSRPCSSTGCGSPRSGSARTSCSATIAPATSRCCATLGARYGFKAEKIDPVRYKDFVVSSTRIRRLISEGRVDEAGALLGHQYFIDGRSCTATERGRTIGFPTANLCTENELLPPHGVYATTVTIDGVVLPSVTNIGDAADRRRVRADDRSRRTSSTSTAISTAPRSASASSSGCATSGRSSRSTCSRRRSPPTARGRACCSIAFRCRITRVCRLPSSSSPSTCRRARPARRHARARSPRRCSATSGCPADAVGDLTVSCTR